MWDWQQRGRSRILQAAWETLQRPSRRRTAKRRTNGYGTKLSFQTLEARHVMAGVVINEFVASNGDGLVDQDGDESDWLELYNSGTETVNLGGWHLTDSASNLTKWEMPAVEIEAGGYLVIFASSKNRAVAGSELHTNFNLSADGEYLALVGPNGTSIVSAYSPSFPPQLSDVSYGIASNQELRYFTTPTPGAANGEGVLGFVDTVEASVERGFYDESFLLELQTATAGASIYYTFDGSIPGADNPAAVLYQEPILVHRTSVFRAAAYLDEHGRSQVTTQTYIFLEDVLTQTIDPLNPENNPQGLSYPEIWQGLLPGNYNMVPDIVSQWDDFNPENNDYGIREALLSLPTMSIVMDHDDLWDPATGIHPNAISHSNFFRRPGSIEYFDPAGGSGFQYNVGVQMHGGASRRVEWSLKHSFRLVFNPDFGGPSELNFPLFDQSDFSNINTVILKGFNQDGFSTVNNPSWSSPLISTYMKDQWLIDTHRAMGHLAVEYTYVHLYINGLYWGLYCAMERVDDAMLASRLGGEREDWDVIRPLGDYMGSNSAWNEMFDIARQMISGDPATADARYFQLQGLNPDGTPNPELPVYLDMDNLIDYLTVHYFAGARGWPRQNWVAARNREDPGTGFQFFVWDQDVALDSVLRNMINFNVAGNTAGTAQELSLRLRNSPEFRLRFADRVHKHLFNDGVLANDETAQRWQGLADYIDLAILGESARWGDARAGTEVRVYASDEHTIILPNITIDHWRDSVEKVHGYLPQYYSLLVSRLTSANLYTALRPPLLNKFGGEVDPGFNLTLSKPAGSPAAATIYYTLDGSDPRLLGGSLSPSAIAYTGPIELDDTTQIRTRMRNGTTWSAIVDTTIGVLTNGPPENFLAGDYDRNGTVEAADYLVWKQSYGQTVEHYTAADGNGDGKIDAADYTVWRNNLGATNQIGPNYSFNVIGQTYTQDFNAFRGTEATLPNHFTVVVDEGIDIYRGTFTYPTDTPASFTGIKGATSDGNDYTFAWRESTGPAGLADTRVLFAFTNNTGQAITGFDVSYDVESWVNGRRDNQVRFKYDVYANSGEAQAAEGRDAFETDVFATPNLFHTPIDNNNQQSTQNGKTHSTPVSGYVDLTTLPLSDANPGLGVFGALMPGQTAYFRWQISNGNLDEGNRSALGIDNISIKALAAAPAAGGGGLAGLIVEAEPPKAAADLAFAALAPASAGVVTAPRESQYGFPASAAEAVDLLLVAVLDGESANDDAESLPIAGEAESDSERDEAFALAEFALAADWE